MTQIPFRVIEGNFTSMDKQKALEAALSQIERNFGKGSIMRLGKNENPMEVEAISTGSLGLDIALGIGGLPRGRVIEIFGPESPARQRSRCMSSPKRRKRAAPAASSTPSMRSIPFMRGKLGVNLEELIISQPDTGEQALEITDTLVRSGAIDVIVVDSVAALTPKGRDRRRDGRRAAGHAGPPDEPGAAQAHGLDLASRTALSSSSIRSA